jgi:cholesterol transport system auxiliary component
MTPSNPHRRLFLLAAPATALTACSNIIGPPSSSQIYSLQTSMKGRPQTSSKVSWSLAIVKPDAPESLDTNRIALTRSDTEFDYYANAVWTDHLPDMIQTRLLSAFEASGRIGIVTREENGFHADYKLLTEIRDFEARYTDSKAAFPTVAVTIVAHAVNVRSRKIASSTTATFSLACAANTLSSVVEAFGVALSEVAARIEEWALDLPAPESLAVKG